MAASISSPTISFLFLSLVLAMIVSAAANYGYAPTVPKPKTDEPKGDSYGYAPDATKPKKTDEPKATGYGYVVPKPKAKKPKFDGYQYLPSVPKPKTYTPMAGGYGYVPNVPKPKTDKPKTTGYEYVPNVPKPKADKPKAEGYGYLPNIPKPKADKPKADGYGYVPNVPKPKTDKPKTTGYEYVPNVPKPKIEKPKAEHGYEVPKTIGIQGLIYCKSGSKLIPLEGATARITCFALDKDGYESAPLSVTSCPADAKGYFLATIKAVPELLEGLKIKECKAFLENSPLKDCNVPTDLNKGITGAPLYTPRPLHDLDLYSVGPLAYAPAQTKPNVPSGY